MVPISPCLDSPAPHIDNLQAAYGAAAFAPPGFSRWSTTYPCSVNTGSWPGPTIVVTGNWWVDCPSFIVNNDKLVEFRDGNVVFNGTVDIRSSAALRINPAATNDHFVVVRSGGSIVKGAQSSIGFEQTAVYLEDGYISLVGGVGGLIWTAPVAGNFEDLALWSESPHQHEIGGQAGNTLTGTFFTPYADPFTLTGQAGQFQTDAQFVTRRLEVKGQGEVKMHPDPDRTTKIPIREVRLIR